MSILDRILGRTPSVGPQITATATPRATSHTSPAASAAPSPPLTPTPAPGPAPAPVAPGAGGVIRVYDQFGRQVQIGRDAWRQDVLLPNLKASRDQPDALYQLIIGALDDGFAADVLDSARHLADHDPQPRRGALVLAVVLLQLQDPAAARDVIERALLRHGDDAHLLANLARAYAALGDEERAERLIWQSLALDPNEQGALHWLITAVHARGGQDAVLAAHTRAATLPGSWRALLWLARFALERGDLDEATRLYQQALGRAHPVPADLLTQMSGDLGNRGRTELLLQLTRPHFDVEAHGLMVGNNLLRAFLELGQFAEARALLEQLYARQRPDWREHLVQWEQRLDDAQQRFGEVTGPLEVVVMKLEQPIWARGTLGFESVLPEKSPQAPRVYFVCGSGESADLAGGKVISQPTNDLGRLTRALPLFLMEEVQLRTHARTTFLLPWMKRGGFVLSGKPWTPAFLPRDLAAPDLLVFLHVDAAATPWLLRVSIVNAQRDVPPVVLERAFGPATAGEDVLALLNDVVSRLTILLALRREDTDAALATPSQPALPGYLAALEQALAVALAARQTGSDFLLHQERSIFDHLFEVALEQPGQWRPRMVLLHALENQARRRPDMVGEYLGKLALLQDQHALLPGRGRELVAAAVASVSGQVRAPTS